MTSLVCRHYANEHYATIFNPENGFFARFEEPGYPEPFWANHGPELIDISVTGWCDRHCGTCYRSSTPQKRHMLLSDYETVIRQASRLNVCQVALGGGNPNQHPDFLKILKVTREKYGIVPNYTTNGKGLTEEILQATAAFCGAVAVSAYEPYTQLAEVLRRLTSHAIKANIHFVLDSESVGTALNWLVDPPSFLLGVNGIIFLNYKPVGRGGSPKRTLSQNDKVQAFLETALSKPRNFKIGFDSCAVSGLASNGIANSVWYDACEAARFSMFVSETLRAYPCSFMESSYEGIPLAEDNLLEIWRDAPLFQQVRNKIRQPLCQGGSCLAICRGGCPIFPEINLCGKGAKS